MCDGPQATGLPMFLHMREAATDFMEIVKYVPPSPTAMTSFPDRVLTPLNGGLDPLPRFLGNSGGGGCLSLNFPYFKEL